tara:strand:- start:785 stop:1360 length:576 start_codon:yes stop_codon:yes gene_type:complete
MHKIKEIIIGTNNTGKYREIYNLLPKKVKKYSPRKLKIVSPKETGKSFKKNSFIKALHYSKKTNLICIADDSGLEVNSLNKAPGIYSSRWAGKKNNFNLAIKKVLRKLKKKNRKAKFICCLTLYWPNRKSYSVKGIVDGKIVKKKKGKNGFGYDPIFVPNGYKKTFGEMSPKFKMSIDHRYLAFRKIRKFF